jgi:hypothetical protein
MAFIKLVSDNLSKSLPAGEGIIKVADSVFKSGPNSEWAKFVVDPHQWLFNHHYRYYENSTRMIGDGKIPASLELIPVYDTETRMHIRIPLAKSLKNVPVSEVPPGPLYDGKFEAVLAHYFMRSCR